MTDFIRRVRWGCLVLVTAAGAAACNPYERSGEYYAGPVDPKDFPRVYRGVGATANSFGVFEPSPAFVRGEMVGYFAFPVPAGVKPLTIRTAAKAPPVAYVFDPGDVSPFPTPAKCKPPANYTYDAQRDFVRFDEQGSVFSTLPTRSLDAVTMAEKFTYVPVVAEVKVTSNGEPCQDAKSAANVVARPDVTVMVKPGTSPPQPVPSGRYLAWAVIDPVADVFFLGGAQNPQTFLGPQKWGWFNHYLLAYLDGGFIPTTEVTVPGQNGAADTQETRATEQVLYVPDTVVDPATGMAAPNTAPGSGFDVLDFKRSDAGYSPICHLKLFTPADPMNPPRDATAIPAATVVDTMTYLYCLQPDPQVP